MKIRLPSGDVDLRFFLAVLAAAIPACAAAEPVAVVSGDRAQAYTFSHQNICYALVPDHITQRDSFSIRASNPTREGTAHMTALRFKQSDFALAVVDGGIEQDCRPGWEELPRDLGPVLPDGGTATLVTIRESGLQERMAVRMSPVTYEHIGATPELESERGRLQKGRSGSLLTVGNTPVGIAIELPVSEKEKGFDAELRVLRMDAIVARIDRYLSGYRPSVAKTEPAPDIQDSRAVPFEVVSWNVTPLSPDNDPTGLAIEGGLAFVVPPLAGRIVTLRLRLGAGEAPVPLRSVRLSSSIGDGTATGPRNIRLYAAKGPDDPEPRRLTSGRISPEGEGEVTMRPQLVKWLEIQIRDVWDPALPLRIDRLVVAAG